MQVGRVRRQIPQACARVRAAPKRGRTDLWGHSPGREADVCGSRWHRRSPASSPPAWVGWLAMRLVPSARAGAQRLLTRQLPLLQLRPPRRRVDHDPVRCQFVAPLDPGHIGVLWDPRPDLRLHIRHAGTPLPSSFTLVGAPLGAYRAWTWSPHRGLTSKRRAIDVAPSPRCSPFHTRARPSGAYAARRAPPYRSGQYRISSVRFNRKCSSLSPLAQVPEQTLPPEDTP
jgi:hypothetical protein